MWVGEGTHHPCSYILTAFKKTAKKKNQVDVLSTLAWWAPETHKKLQHVLDGQSQRHIGNDTST